MSGLEGFEAWPKIPRLRRNIVVTEKIDGTNACVGIRQVPIGEDIHEYETAVGDHALFAQSRTRIITPTSDNYGFARWAFDNAATLVEGLGVGRHFGEWWGQGIQRGYGLVGKRFSLFNTKRWSGLLLASELESELALLPHQGSTLDLLAEAGVRVVPTLLGWTFDTAVVDLTVRQLADFGSVAAPGFTAPEGVVVFHPQSQHMFKVLCHNDDVPKTLVAP